MQNFVQQGDVLTLTAPTGGVTAGVPVKIGSLIVIPLGTAAATVAFEGKVNGVFSGIAKLTTDDLVEGSPLYWDDTNSRLTLTSTSNTFIGHSTEITATSAATCTARFCGTPGV